MVERICRVCDELFHPYGPDDFVCDSCIDELSFAECEICGFVFKPGRSFRDICRDCLSDEELEELNCQSNLIKKEIDNDSNDS